MGQNLCRMLGLEWLGLCKDKTIDYYWRQTIRYNSTSGCSFPVMSTIQPIGIERWNYASECPSEPVRCKRINSYYEKKTCLSVGGKTDVVYRDTFPEKAFISKNSYSTSNCRTSLIEESIAYLTNEGTLLFT